MALSVRKYDNQFMNDLDQVYERIKTTHAAFINVGKLFYDDRTKLFEVCICDGWNEWVVLSYNQCRIAHNAVVARFIMQLKEKPKGSSDDSNKKPSVRMIKEN